MPEFAPVVSATLVMRQATTGDRLRPSRDSTATSARSLIR
jgi:hypothetical protein